MNIDDYACQQLALYMTGHKDCGVNYSGRELVDLFNKYGGFRDVYDMNIGLPIIQKGLKTSKKTYAEDRLKKMNNSDGLHSLIEEIVEKSNWPEKSAEEINSILSAFSYSITRCNEKYMVSGIIIKKASNIINNPRFDEIQKNVLSTLDKAKLSIDVAVAWFTNQVLFNKLIEKKDEGVNVRVVINKDGVNKKHGIDISKLNAVKIRSERGGIMHDKFCVIDNQIVISGSYNWTNSAEFNNSENIIITENDNPLATKFSLEFKRLWDAGNKLIEQKEI